MFMCGIVPQKIALLQSSGALHPVQVAELGVYLPFSHPWACLELAGLDSEYSFCML